MVSEEAQMIARNSELNKIKRHRAETDPIILHDGTGEWYERDCPPSRETIIEDREALISEYPDGERIPVVTWAEALAYCFTASMDARMVGPEFTGIFQYVFTRYLGDRGLNADSILPDSFGTYTGLPPGIGSDEQGEESLGCRSPQLEEHVEKHGREIAAEPYQESAHQLREEMKTHLDELFVDERYSDLPFDTNVPASFWGTEVKQGQTGLDMF